MIASESTLWLSVLLLGNESGRGWCTALLDWQAKARHNELYESKVCHAIITIAAIESELDYRRNGELVPSGD